MTCVTHLAENVALKNMQIWALFQEANAWSRVDLCQSCLLEITFIYY